MQETRAYYLIKGYYHDCLTAEEWIEFEELLSQNPSLVEEKLQLLMHELSESSSGLSFSEEKFQDSLNEIFEIDKVSQRDLPPVVFKERSYFKWFSVAAAIIIMAIIPIYFYKQHKSSVPEIEESFVVKDFQPGTDGGILKLESGKILDLGSLPEGKSTINEIENVRIQVNRSAATYSIIQEKATDVLVYQEIETPKGKKFKVNLSDGTSIWLNSGSKLRYPIQFGSGVREVYLIGEAYFEVASNPNKPFRVKFENQDSEIEVLGTHFNVRNYPENNGIYTSLFEGKVKVVNGASNRILKPGEVAFAAKNGNITVSLLDNPDDHIAWKENFFSFNNADLKDVMTELGRWYNFEVEFPDSIKSEKYSGKIGKDLTLNQVLEILGGTNLKYKVISSHKIRIVE